MTTKGVISYNMSDAKTSINYASEEPVAYVASPMPFTIKDFETLSQILALARLSGWLYST